MFSTPLVEDGEANDPRKMPDGTTRRKPDDEPTELLDEEEQQKIVHGLRVEGAQLDRRARWAGALVNLGVFGLVFRCVVSLMLPSQYMEAPYGVYSEVIAAGSLERLLLAHLITELVCLVSAVVCLGKARRVIRRCAMVLACVPASLWLSTLRRMAAPWPFYWIVAAAPLSLGLSLYIDRDLAKLAIDITFLDTLRYKYKGV